MNGEAVLRGEMITCEGRGSCNDRLIEGGLDGAGTMVRFSMGNAEEVAARGLLPKLALLDDCILEAEGV